MTPGGRAFAIGGASALLIVAGSGLAAGVPAGQVLRRALLAAPLGAVAGGVLMLAWPRPPVRKPPAGEPETPVQS